MGADYGSMGGVSGGCDSRAGFAATDALIAVTILATSLALCLGAAQTAGRASRAAAEVREAQLILRGRLETASGRSGVWTGRDQNLGWRLEAAFLDPNAAMAGAGPCSMIVTGEDRRSGRTYRLATIHVCRAETGASPAAGEGA